MGISFLNSFIDKKSKSKTMEKNIPTVINFLPASQESFIVKIEKTFPTSPFSKPLQKNLIWTGSKCKSPVVQFLEERPCGVVEGTQAGSPRTWPLVQALLPMQYVTLVKSPHLSKTQS